MSVKVGLETSSTSATPNPSASPFANTVLPAPRSPYSRICAGILWEEARALARSKVCRSDVESMLCGRAPRFRQKPQEVGGYQALLTNFFDCQVSRQTMQINRQTKPLDETPQVLLRQNPHD